MDNIDYQMARQILSNIQESAVKQPLENGETYLHLLIRKTRLESHLIQVLQSWPDVIETFINVQNAFEETVLHLAIKKRYKEVVDFLIISGADVNWRGKNGNTLAHYAIRSGNKKMRIASAIRPISEQRHFAENITDFTKWFLSKGWGVLCKNNDQISPLVLAVKLGFYEILPLLLERDNDVSYVDESNKNLLHLFFEMTMHQRTFQPAESEVVSYSSPYFKSAISALVDKGVSVDAVDNEGNTPLHLAATHPEKWSEVIDPVLNRLSNVNAKNSKGSTVLHILTKNCNYVNEVINTCYTKFVRALVDKNAEINIADAKDLTPLHYAVSRKYLPIFQMLKDHGADCSVKCFNENLLHIFGRSEVRPFPEFSKAIVESLIKEGCDVNAKNKSGMTPLHFACQSSDLAAVQCLLNHGADVHARESSEDGYTPLHEAADYNQRDIMNLLVKCGADVNALDGFRRTPLHIALKSRYEVELLLKLGAQVDVYDSEGILPLHQAIIKTKRSNIRALLEFGASINDYGTIEEICCTDYQRIVLEVILDHWFKMKWVGMYVMEEYADFVGEWNDFQNKYEDCLKEIVILKERLIDGRVSCYNFLRMSLDKRCKYVQNEKVQEFMKSETLVKTFPNYWLVILAAYRQSIARKTLLEPAVLAWYSATNVLLPLECVSMIVCYLENLDLVGLINGGKRYSQEVIVID